jgi:hypothetical protein
MENERDAGHVQFVAVKSGLKVEGEKLKVGTPSAPLARRLAGRVSHP